MLAKTLFMFEVKTLNVDIGPIRILQDASLRIEAGEMVGLIGRNGAGKTTFLRSVMGLLNAVSGQMNFDDVDLTVLPSQKRAGLGFGYMPEDRKLVPSLTVEENIMIPVWAVESNRTDRKSWNLNGMMRKSSNPCSKNSKTKLQESFLLHITTLLFHPRRCPVKVSGPRLPTYAKSLALY